MSNNLPAPRLLLTFFSLLFLVGIVQGQTGGNMRYPDTGDVGTGGNNTILGNLYQPSGQRVDRRIRVRLVTSTRGEITTMTSDDGSFSFRRLATGQYTVVVDGETDYQPSSQSVYFVSPVRGGPPQTAMVSINLKLKSTGEYKSAVVDSRLANVPAHALEHYNKAVELAKGGKRKDAIEQLKQAVSDYPDFMLAYNEMGVQYLRLGELEKAEESLRSALKIKPDAFEPLMNHGIALVRLKRFDEAEPELRAAVKQKDQSDGGHFYLGQALAYLQRYDEAEKELNLAIQLGGDDKMKEAHRYLAGVYNAQGDKKRAISELETYLKLAPNSKDADHLRQLIQQLRGPE